MAMIKRLVSDRRGAQMVEYVLLVGVVVLLSVVAFKKFGWAVREKVDKQTQQVEADDD